jgi:tetratricopeptide (TPR) repeat protein
MMKLGVASMAVLVLAAGCASFTRYGSLTNTAQQQYQSGLVDDAVSNLVAALKVNPGYAPAATLLRRAAPEAYQKHEKAAADFESAKLWDDAVGAYDRLSELSDAVAGLGAGYPTRDIKKKRDHAARLGASVHLHKGREDEKRARFDDAADEFLAADRLVPGFEDSKALAARAHYEAGKALYDKKRFKDSAKEFHLASSVVPGYKDSEDWFQKARQKAIVRVAVMPFVDDSGRGMGDAVTDRIVSQVMSKNPDFVELLTRDNLGALLQEKGLKSSALVDHQSAVKVGKLLGVDFFVYGKILSARASMSSENVLGPYSNSIRRHVYGNPKQGIPDRDVILSVSYTIHSKSSLADMTASYQIVDAKTGRIANSKTLSDKSSDMTKWVMYEGAQEAIPARAFDGTTPNRHEPADPESLMEQVSERLGNTLAYEVYGYFE